MLRTCYEETGVVDFGLKCADVNGALSGPPDHQFDL